MAERWYSLSDIPDLRCHVRLWWMVHGTPTLVEAVRTWVPRARVWQWMTLRADGPEFLPPKGREKSAWAPSPECWQPASDAWTWPNGVEPTPLLPHRVPRVEGTKMKFSAVSDAEASEMAREMEADRETARVAGADKKAFEQRWWLDITAIRYERPGEVSRKMAEGRVLRALAWCGAGKGLTLANQTVSGVIARMADVASGAAVAAEIEMQERLHGLQRFQPLPQDHEDFLEAMRWYSAMSPPETWGKRRESWALSRAQRVMLFRTLTIPLSWGDLAHEFRVSAVRCRQIFESGIDACWRVSNGEGARFGATAVDQMSALRERNREHRSRS